MGFDGRHRWLFAHVQEQVQHRGAQRRARGRQDPVHGGELVPVQRALAQMPNIRHSTPQEPP